MPAVGVAMERSLQAERGLGPALMDLVARSVVAGFSRNSRRDISGQITNASTAFSSWDNCMQVAYCKWPAIALIIVGGLIIISVIWCVIRCACCGLSCCCGCFSCLKCCGNCCGCCDAPQKRAKYLDDPYVPPHFNQPYQSQAPMMTSGVAKKPELPQYAEFDASKKRMTMGDSLPVMPSWERSESKQVAVEADAMEMNDLQKPENNMNNMSNMSNMNMSNNLSQPTIPTISSATPTSQANTMAPMSNYRGNTAYNARPGLPGEPMPQSRSTTGPYSPRNPMRSATDPYNGNQGYGSQGYQDQGYNSPGYNDQQYGHDEYNNMATGGGAAPAIGNAGAMIMMNQNRKPSQPDFGFPQSQTPKPYEMYNRNASPANSAFSNGGGYARAPPARSQTTSPYTNPDQMMRPPVAPNAGYDYDPTQRPTSWNNRAQPPIPYRQYSNNSPSPQLPPPSVEILHERTFSQNSEPHSPLHNNGGFDFTSGYSRPSSSASRKPSPAPAQNNGAQAYPGYRAYKPQGS